MSVSARQAKRHQRQVAKARITGASVALTRAAMAAGAVSTRGMARLTSARMNAAAFQAAAQLNRRAVASKDTGFVDVAAAAYAYNTTGSITLLNTVAQGASVNQRIGKKYALKSLQCRGFDIGDSTAIDNYCSFLIVYDKRPTGALPAITDILVTASSLSQNNDANSGRFRIMKREDFVLVGNPSLTGVVANALTEKTMREESWFLKLNGLPVVCKAAGTGAIGDIEEGALYLITVGATPAGTADANMTVGFRLRFVDTH